MHLANQKSWSDNSKVRRLFFAFLLADILILAFSPNAYGQIITAGTTNLDRLHGGLVIDPEGIKAAVIRLSDVEQGPSAEVVYMRVIDTPLVQNQSGKFAPEVIKATGQAVLRLYTEMTQQHRVHPWHVYIIGSSDFDPDDLEELANEIRKYIGKTLTFLTPESEMQLGIISTIPRRYREGTTWFDNRSQSVLIDIGSSNTKVGYVQVRQPLSGKLFYDFVTLGIPVGIDTFTNELNGTLGGGTEIKEFALNAATLSARSVREALRKETERRPGLAHRRKIYLKGAIVWAMMTLLYPEDRQPFVTITMDDINDFYRRAVNSPQALLNPNLSQISDEQVRMEVGREVEAVRSAFTAKRLIAGAEILKAIATEYNFREVSKKILVARFSKSSSILSYVLLQAENGQQP
jgi:hypothetical protein